MANEQKDVRVRFSAEGIAEVVTAFQKLSSEGKKSAHETHSAFEKLNEQFAEVGKSLIAGFSIVYAADALKELFEQTLENAEALSRLSKQTGLSTATIQAFARAARETGIGADVANAGIQRFTAAVGKAEAGSQKTRGALSDLGIDIKEFAALSPDQKFELVAQRLASIADPARRARDETALFSRSGIELDQALVKVGEEGLGPFITKLQDLGIFLDQKTIDQLRQTKDRLRDMKTQAEGLATQLITGLVPALAKVLEETEKLSRGGNVFKKIGGFVGETAFRVPLATIKSAGSLFSTAGSLAGELFTKGITPAFRNAADRIRDIGKIWKEVHEDPAVPPEEGGGGGGGGVASGEVNGAVARARVDLIKARLDNQAKLYQATDQLILQDAKNNYADGELSLQDYFALREAIISAGFDKEIAIAKAKLKAEESLPVDINDEAAKLEKAAKEEKLRGQVADLNAQRETAIQQERNNLHEEEIKLDEKKAAVEEKLLQIEGRKTDAARKRLEIEAAALDRQLAAGGVAPADRAAAKSTFLTQGGAAIDFQDASDKAKADLSRLDTEKKAIQDQVNSGEIFSIQGEQKLLELDRQRLPLLQQDAQAMLDFANKTKDPQLIASAEAFKEKIQQIGVNINESSKYMKEMRDGIQQAVGAGFNTFLTDAILNSKSLGEAFHNAAKSMLADLARIAIQIEEEKFLKGLFGGAGGGLFGLFGGGGFSVGLGGGGSVVSDPGFATGGYIRGPGSTTSDSIPIRASDREYIVSAEATQRPGILPLLDAINGGLRVPQFASGGYVSSVGSQFSQSAFRGGTPITFRIPPEALGMTLRDWFEREIAHNMNMR